MTSRLLALAVALLAAGCRFEEPAPSRQIYFESMADGPPRPADHISRFVRPPVVLGDRELPEHGERVGIAQREAELREPRREAALGLPVEHRDVRVLGHGLVGR